MFAVTCLHVDESFSHRQFAWPSWEDVFPIVHFQNATPFCYKLKLVFFKAVFTNTINVPESCLIVLVYK